MSSRGAITWLSILAALAIAPGAAVADDVIVVPFAGEDGALASDLAVATAGVLEQAPAVSARVAEASRADVLTLAECPDAGPTCIGQLAEALDVDRAVSGSISFAPGAIAIELRVVHRDGAVVTHAIQIPAGERPAIVERFKSALAEKLRPASEPPEASSVELTTTEAATPPGWSEPAVSPPGATAPAPGLSARRAADTGPAIQPATWAVLGLGGFGAVLGTAFLIKADRTESEIRTAPAETDADLRAIRALEDRGDTEKTTGVVMLVIGSAAVLGGAAMLALDLSRARDVQVAISPAGGGFAVSARGRF